MNWSKRKWQSLPSVNRLFQIRSRCPRLLFLHATDTNTQVKFKSRSSDPDESKVAKAYHICIAPAAYCSCSGAVRVTDRRVETKQVF